MLSRKSVRNKMNQQTPRYRCERATISLVLIVAFSLDCRFAQAEQTDLPKLKEVQITNSLDGDQQPVLYWCPDSAIQKPEEATPTPLFVFLHSWSGNYKQNNDKWLKQAVAHNWIYLHPNFRGPNSSPKACGSKFARQDVLDAMDWAIKTFDVDPSRIYLCGVSGGGHMAMLMAGHHPDRFTSVSAWVGISDVAEWYRFHLKVGKPQKYAQMIMKCFGAAPGSNPEIDAEYRDRSPLFHIHRVGDLPIDIFAGINDGHSGSVPVSHSLRAFNAIAKAHGSPEVSEAEIEQLWQDRKLQNPRPGDIADDDVLGREIRLRRTSGNARVTIFEGGHESIPEAAIAGILNVKPRP